MRPAKKFILSETASPAIAVGAPSVKAKASSPKISGYTYLSNWLAFKNDTYYLSSDLLFEEVCKVKTLLMTPMQTYGVEQVLKAVIEQSPEEGSDIDYRLRLILNGSGTEVRLLSDDSSVFERNNRGNIWKSVNPKPDSVPDLKVKDSDIFVEVKAYGSVNNARQFVEGAPAQKFYNADFVCCRLIKETPQKWVWYQKHRGYYSKCMSTPNFLPKDLTLQPEICKVTYDYSTGHKCLKIMVT